MINSVAFLCGIKSDPSALYPLKSIHQVPYYHSFWQLFWCWNKCVSFQDHMIQRIKKRYIMLSKHQFKNNSPKRNLEEIQSKWIKIFFFWYWQLNKFIIPIQFNDFINLLSYVHWSFLWTVIVVFFDVRLRCGTTAVEEPKVQIKKTYQYSSCNGPSHWILRFFFLIIANIWWLIDCCWPLSLDKVEAKRRPTLVLSR